MVKLEMYTDEFLKNLEQAKIKVRYLVSKQIRDDSNQFVRWDTGELKRSSERGSDLPNGIIGWDTSYAKRVYFTGRPSTDVNPNASLEWVQVARARYSDDWVNRLVSVLKEVSNG